jgi:hypothetical protein
VYALSIASSFIVGALVILQLAGMHIFLADQLQHASSERTALEVGASLATVLEHDLRRMGLDMEDPRGAIVSADSTSISFWGNLDDDVAIEAVTYDLGPKTSAAETSNPNDRVLFRIVDSEPVADVALGVVGFHLDFYDYTGAETSDWGAVRSIHYTITVESPEPTDPFDPVRTITSGVVFPRNLTL